MNTSHYPSLELCKKLTKIGFPITQCLWMKYIQDYHEIIIRMDEWVVTKGVYVCPSVMEMLEHIRTIEGENNHEYNIRITYVMQGKYHVEYDYSFGPKFGFQDTLPNALAEMILWLHKNDYISFNDN